jgi:phosphopantothenoylcysteine synthetase/decarboxylase
MRLLVTAGNTLTLIDRVRGITNIFTGRTGARIAAHARLRGHAVTLLTSHPEAVAEVGAAGEPPDVLRYLTFEDLAERLECLARGGGFDAIVHCAAVSDYRSSGVYAPALGTRFDPAAGLWRTDDTALSARMEDRAAGKVKSDEPELWLRLERTPKLVDSLRRDWGFVGVLVKFKLEVGVGEDRLLEIAERSRRQSGADLMVANTLEGSPDWALLGPVGGRYERLLRAELPGRLLDAVEAQHAKRSRHG